MKSTHTALALLTAVVLALAAADAVPRGTGTLANVADVDAARAQARLARVERELMARDASELTAEEWAARAEYIRALRAYRSGASVPRVEVP